MKLCLCSVFACDQTRQPFQSPRNEIQNTSKHHQTILPPQGRRHTYPRHSVAIDDPKAAAEDDGTATSNLEICGSTLRCPRFHQSPLKLPLRGTSNKQQTNSFCFFEFVKFEMPSNNSRKQTENMCMCCACSNSKNKIQQKEIIL